MTREAAAGRDGRGDGPRSSAGAGLAVLVKRFPRLSETFVLNEVLELKRQGIPLRLFAIADAKEPYAQPEAEALRPELSYLRYGDSFSARLRLLSDLLWALYRHPSGFLAARRLARHRGSAATWKHFLEACTLARRMDSAGLRHLHALFASGPSSVAHYVHLMTGVSYSFTAHAKDLFTTPPKYVTERTRAARFVATCTGSNRLYLEGLGEEVGRKVVVIPHGVDLDRFAAIARRPEPGRLLSIGRLVSKKGFDVLLRSVALLREEGLDLTCRIIGDGPLQKELEELAATLGVADRVVFGGARPQLELLEELAGAQVFVLSPVLMPDGDRDGVPNVLIEAMASGIPVVASEISGIPELIRDNDTGLLVPAADPKALADALRRLLTDPGLRRRIANAGREFVNEHRALHGSVRPLADKFRECLGQAPA